MGSRSPERKRKPGERRTASASPVLKKRQDVEENRGVNRSGSPVRLPHSPKPADNFQLIPSKSPAMFVSSDNNQPDTKDDIMPALCSCLFGLCGSLFHLGDSPRQNYSSVTDQDLPQHNYCNEQ